MHRSIYLENEPSGFRASVRQLDDESLRAHAGDGNVVVRISHSTLNYKDGLAITNRSPVVRKWPMVPGIDGAGVVEESNDPRWKPGDRVVMNGWGVGETHWGCLAGKARLKGDWLIALPAQLSEADAMAIGTAGYTAMLCAQALERGGVRPEQGEVLVTGAAGGVGSVAIAILAARGFRVVASTGRPQEADYLKSLGASEVIERSALSTPGKPLQRERWAGVIDAVGSHTLANACAQTRYRGTVAACGLAQGMELPASVAPFILRGIRLIGIDSVMCPIAEREHAWAALAREIDRDRLAAISRTIGLDEAIPAAAEVLAGSIRGRLVVDLSH